MKLATLLASAALPPIVFVASPRDKELPGFSPGNLPGSSDVDLAPVALSLSIFAILILGGVATSIASPRYREVGTSIALGGILGLGVVAVDDRTGKRLSSLRMQVLAARGAR